VVLVLNQVRDLDGANQVQDVVEVNVFSLVDDGNVEGGSGADTGAGLSQNESRSKGRQASESSEHSFYLLIIIKSGEMRPLNMPKYSATLQCSNFHLRKHYKFDLNLL